MDVLLILIMVFQDGTHLIPVNIQIVRLFWILNSFTLLQNVSLNDFVFLLLLVLK